LATPAELSFEEKKAMVLGNPLAGVLERFMKAHPDVDAGDLIEGIYAFM
jgi:hypothetical protein